MIAGNALVALVSGLALASAQSTLKPSSPVSDVEGLAFNRFVNIWLENIVRRLRLSAEQS